MNPKCVWCLQPLDDPESAFCEVSAVRLYGRVKSFRLLYHPDCHVIFQEHRQRVLRRQGRFVKHLEVIHDRSG